LAPRRRAKTLSESAGGAELAWIPSKRSLADQPPEVVCDVKAVRVARRL